MNRISMLAWTAVVLCCGLCPAETRSVALTFDDLPLAGEGGATDAQGVNRAILLALARHHAPAIAFVNEKRVREIGVASGQAVLRDWLANGQDLGNHTFSHRDLNTLTVEEFRTEVIEGEASLRQVLQERGRALRYLRFPYNHSGDTKEKHDAVAAFLSERGYMVATCTIDNSDWEFARAYDLMATRGEREALTKLQKEYLAYTEAEIDYYTELDRKVLGREVPHVMLLHANRLNAGMMDELLRLFEKRGYRFVTLGEAQSDPAYRGPDTFVTSFGPMWGYRWAEERGVKIDGRLEPEPPAWVLQYGKK
jgi:peptidoglycan/xylan/chitin deacetylase (PgdA/CDA1 family)